MFCNKNYSNKNKQHNIYENMKFCEKCFSKFDFSENHMCDYEKINEAKRLLKEEVEKLNFSNINEENLIQFVKSLGNKNEKIYNVLMISEEELEKYFDFLKDRLESIFLSKYENKKFDEETEKKLRKNLGIGKKNPFL